MLPQIEKVPNAAPRDQKDDELLIIIGAPQVDHAPWVEQLIEARYQSLDKSHHYSRYLVGFRGTEGKQPYMIVDWTSSGQNATERRWVAGRLHRFVTQQFRSKKLRIFLEQGATTEQLVMAEDLALRGSTPRYEKSLWDYVKIETPSADDLMTQDPCGSIRMRRGLEYRAWVNENPDELTSIEIGERLRQFCQQKHLSFESFDEKKLKELDMNLLLAVGQASQLSPSRLHIATHRLEKGGAPLMLIGKGVTFDTGGINVKPHEGFVNCMKNDMGGAALMAQMFMALVESGYPHPLVLVIPTCENLVAEKSMKPGSIIKSHAGKTVLIEHTDAEGRLILADAIAYAQKRFAPRLSCVAATLTTASLRQFTNYFTPVHFANAAFQTALRSSGESWAESFTFWDEFLPFAQGNRSPAADLTNMGRMPGHSSMGGGSNVAAHFLKEFATHPLIHFDTFASAWNWSGDYPGAHYGATGAPFHSLFDCFRKNQDFWGY